MDILIQSVYLLYYLMIGAVGFSAIGKTPEGSKLASQGRTAFIHGLCTIAFLIFWETPDDVSFAAKMFAIALLWVPWLIDWSGVNKPWKPITVANIIVGELIVIARIGVVLAFWVF